MKLTLEEGQLLAQILNSVRTHCQAELQGSIHRIAPVDASRAQWNAAVIALCDKLLSEYAGAVKISDAARTTLKV